MRDDESWSAETIEFVTSDGVQLVGDLIAPADAGGGAAITRAVAVCHPHPQYGGNRFNPVVESCWRALADAGVPALRFDFRAEYGLGESERLDLVAALDVLAATFPDARLGVVGYSFGAMVALGTRDERVAMKVLIAPPLSRMQVDPAVACPTFVLTPAPDQFNPPEAAREATDNWAMSTPSVSMEVVEMSDHFLHGRTQHVADRATAWLTAH